MLVEGRVNGRMAKGEPIISKVKEYRVRASTGQTFSVEPGH